MLSSSSRSEKSPAGTRQNAIRTMSAIPASHWYVTAGVEGGWAEGRPRRTDGRARLFAGSAGVVAAAVLVLRFLLKVWDYPLQGRVDCVPVRTLAAISFAT